MSALIHEPSVTSLAEYIAENYEVEKVEKADKPEQDGAAKATTRTDQPSAVARPHSSSVAGKA